jgi:hypothetical protein
MLLVENNCTQQQVPPNLGVPNVANIHFSPNGYWGRFTKM